MKHRGYKPFVQSFGHWMRQKVTKEELCKYNQKNRKRRKKETHKPGKTLFITNCCFRQNIFAVFQLARAARSRIKFDGVNECVVKKRRDSIKPKFPSEYSDRFMCPVSEKLRQSDAAGLSEYRRLMDRLSMVYWNGSLEKRCLESLPRRLERNYQVHGMIWYVKTAASY